MNKLKTLAGETVLYGLGSILPRFLNFLLVTLHTAVFAPAEYGIITKLFAYVAVINIIFMLGMETAYFRFATKPGANEKQVFNLAQTVVITVSTFLSLLGIILVSPITEVLDIHGQNTLVIELIVIMFMDAIVSIPFARLRLHKKPKTFALAKLANIGILVGLNVYFLKLAYDPSIGIGFVVLANLAANLFYILIFSKTLFSWRPIFDKKISSEMLVYAYPIMFMGLAGMTNEMFSRITLEWWLPENFYKGQTAEHALGVFGACYKFGMLMSLAVQAFRYAAEPFFFSNAADKTSPQLFAKVNHFFILTCCILLLGVSINLDIFKYFLGNVAYWEGLHIVPILLLAYLFLGVYYNMSIWYKLTDKTYFGTLITVGGAGLTILMNYLLIPRLGYLGSSWVTFLCYFMMTAACYMLGKKYYPIPYNLTKGALYILFTLGVVYAVNAIEIPNQWLATGFHALVLILFIGGLYTLEKDYLKEPIT